MLNIPIISETPKKTRLIIEKIEKSLVQLGSSFFCNVTKRTRIIRANTTNIAKIWIARLNIDKIGEKSWRIIFTIVLFQFINVWK